MKAYGGVDVQIPIVLTSTLVGGEWPASRPCCFTPGTHWIGGWVGSRAGLDNVEKNLDTTITLRLLSNKCEIIFQTNNQTADTREQNNLEI
jgi:hypothetical protein